MRSIEAAVVTDTVNLYDAKTNLSKLVDRAAAGEEIVIAKAGKPKGFPPTRQFPELAEAKALLSTLSG
jgi:hypothetical protein